MREGKRRKEEERGERKGEINSTMLRIKLMNVMLSFIALLNFLSNSSHVNDA